MPREKKAEMEARLQQEIKQQQDIIDHCQYRVREILTAFYQESLARDAAEQQKTALKKKAKKRDRQHAKRIKELEGQVRKLEADKSRLLKGHQAAVEAMVGK